VRRHQPFISQRHRQHRHRFRRGTGEIIKHAPLAFLLAALRQPFAGCRIFIFAERMKLFARHDVCQSQPFRARADPLAGTDFPGSIVIILRQVFVEVTLGVTQVFLRHDRKHKASFHPFFKRLCSFLEQSLISFIHRFGILPAGKPATVSPMTRNAFLAFPTQRVAESEPNLVSFMRQFYRMPRPLLRNLYTIGISRSATIYRLSFYRNCPCCGVSPSQTDLPSGRHNPVSSLDFIGQLPTVHFARHQGIKR
jgi:hypothetical protein